MKKIILVIMMLCILCTFTACKKEEPVPEDIAPAWEAAQEETEEAEEAEEMQVQESLELELEEGAEGALAPE